MNDDLISREALKKKFERLVDETIPYGGVAVNDMRELIDNAPIIEIATKLQPNCNNLQQPQGKLANEVWKLYEKHQSHLATRVIEFGDELKELLDKYQKGGTE